MDKVFIRNDLEYVETSQDKNPNGSKFLFDLHFPENFSRMVSTAWSRNRPVNKEVEWALV
eukprot:4770032-Amphidinium_carterae.1